MSLIACTTPSCTKSVPVPAVAPVVQPGETLASTPTPRASKHTWSVNLVDSVEEPSTPNSCKGTFASGKCFTLGQSIPIRVTHVALGKDSLGYNAIEATLIPLDMSAVEAHAFDHPGSEYAVAHNGEIISRFLIAGRMPDFISLSSLGTPWSETEVQTLLDSFRR